MWPLPNAGRSLDSWPCNRVRLASSDRIRRVAIRRVGGRPGAVVRDDGFALGVGVGASERVLCAGRLVFGHPGSHDLRALRRPVGGGGVAKDGEQDRGGSVPARAGTTLGCRRRLRLRSVTR